MENFNNGIAISTYTVLQNLSEFPDANQGMVLFLFVFQMNIPKKRDHRNCMWMFLCLV